MTPHSRPTMAEMREEKWYVIGEGMTMFMSEPMRNIYALRLSQ
jgi:hypothetical protein